MHACIINKRFAGSGLSSLIVSTDIIAEKSIEQAFRAKHYNQILGALQLTYEALQQRIVPIAVEGLKISDEVHVALQCLRHPSNYTKSGLDNALQEIKENEEFDS